MKKLGLLKNVMFLLVILILAACSVRQEENSTDIEDPVEGIIDNGNESSETDLDLISI